MRNFKQGHVPTSSWKKHGNLTMAHVSSSGPALGFVAGSVHPATGFNMFNICFEITAATKITAAFGFHAVVFSI